MDAECKAQIAESCRLLLYSNPLSIVRFQPALTVSHTENQPKGKKPFDAGLRYITEPQS